MNLFTRLKELFSRRAKSLSVFRGGLSKAKAGDFQGAILEYSKVIDAPSNPPDLVAMAMYNRALAYSAIGNEERAAEDLKRVLRMPELPENIKTSAIQRQERIRRRLS